MKDMSRTAGEEEVEEYEEEGKEERVEDIVG